ncbi:beta-ketoacyl synthase chain length factor [Chiayiivirga flava]|uniref:Beta-ketoacyl synthase-like N-terminal domain-containing protein n=1 Tax=Chiayiivirga flava TaxID=659595 RepID=A0A7W8FZ42_9GAMM|nr:beta-ketoacyl synthase chain length factor [Chiayiivirga flava]MBB5206784.1 hypothetical protein [Chiayiivirga flava]
MIQFDLIDWAACAPGLATRDAWRAWAVSAFLPAGDETPALAELPPMMRRRIDRLGRVAIQALAWCRDADATGVPVVFASRHGDVARSQQLLETLAADASLSPAGFGLSVHNAIAALYSLAYAERGNYTALAAGIDSAEAAAVEAAGLLGDGAPQVLLVVYDAVIPAVHADFLDEPDPCYAWAWRIAPAGSGGTRLSLDTTMEDAPPPPHAPRLPHGLDVLRFVLSGDAQLQHRGATGTWRWRRDA